MKSPAFVARATAAWVPIALVPMLFTQAPTPDPFRQDAAVLADFASRVEAYAELHRCIEGPESAIEVSSDPAEILRAIDTLGDRIRAARATAKQGDIFTPEIAHVIRRIIRESSGGDFGQLLLIVTEDDMAASPSANVNGTWPSDVFPTMPVNVLVALPPLPDELEYRFLGRDLVLRDRYANVIVDVLVDAIPPITSP